MTLHPVRARDLLALSRRWFYTGPMCPLSCRDHTAARHSRGLTLIPDGGA